MMINYKIESRGIIKMSISNKNNFSEPIDFSKGIYDPITTIVESQIFKDAVQKEVTRQLDNRKKVHIEIDDEEWERNHYNISVLSNINNGTYSIQCDFNLANANEEKILLNGISASEFCNKWMVPMNYFLLHMKVNDDNRLIRPKVIHFICTDNPNDDDFGCQLHLATVYFTNNSSSSGVGYIPFNGVPWKISKQYSPILNYHIKTMRIIDHTTNQAEILLNELLLKNKGYVVEDENPTIESLTIGVDFKSI